ncbi:unnamed protein product, partial [Prorocentrum cordatum]
PPAQKGRRVLVATPAAAPVPVHGRAAVGPLRGRLQQGPSRRRRPLPGWRRLRARGRRGPRGGDLELGRDLGVQQRRGAPRQERPARADRGRAGRPGGRPGGLPPRGQRAQHAVQRVRRRRQRRVPAGRRPALASARGVARRPRGEDRAPGVRPRGHAPHDEVLAGRGHVRGADRRLDRRERRRGRAPHRQPAAVQQVCGPQPAAAPLAGRNSCAAGDSGARSQRPGLRQQAQRGAPGLLGGADRLLHGGGDAPPRQAEPPVRDRLGPRDVGADCLRGLAGLRGQGPLAHSEHDEPALAPTRPV